jgi:hypothetical protein
MFHWIDQDKKDFIGTSIFKKEFSKCVSAHPKPINKRIKIVNAQINDHLGLPFIHLLLSLITQRSLTKSKDNILHKIIIFSNEKAFLFL